jgi:hypothetical protein
MSTESNPPTGPSRDRPRITRRQLLALGAAVAAAGTVGTGATVASWWNQAPVGTFRHLSAPEAEFIRAVAGAMFPTTQTIPFDAENAGIDHFLDEAMANLPDELQKALRLLLHGLDAWPRLGRWSRFSELPLDARQDIIQGWNDSSLPEIRAIGNMLTLLVGIGYTTHPDVAPWFRSMHGCAFGREFSP